MRTGKSYHPLYNTWLGMIHRCYNRWRDSFDAFAADVGDRPSPMHTIDRIDNNGNYEPGNVRWATRKQQMANRGVSSMGTLEEILLNELRDTGILRRPLPDVPTRWG